MKKLLFIVFICLLSLSFLTGCSTPADAELKSGQSTSTANTSKNAAEVTQDTATANEPLSGTVKTGGSTSVEKVMTALIYQFQDENRDVTINYEMNGSGDGIKNTISGLYEIGHSSRELKTDGSEEGIIATAYAIDGIAVVLHPTNKVESLLPSQIKDIYTGNITNWKDVGGDDELITVITREESSGTRSAFAEIVGLEKKDDPNTAILPIATVCDSTGAVQTMVSQNTNAIGYMSFSDVDDTKVKSVKYDGVKISTTTLKDGSYKLKREFYLLEKKDATLSPAAKAFIDFIISEKGQAIVAGNNLLPVK